MIINSLPLENYNENEPTLSVIVKLCHENNPFILSLIPQFLEKLDIPTTDNEKGVSITTKRSLLILLEHLRTTYPELVEKIFSTACPGS